VRLVLDTNTALLAELHGVMTREKFARQLATRGLTVGDLFDGYAALMMIVTPAAITPVVTRDSDDDHVIACALAAQAVIIVSGDNDLLVLGDYRGIRIVNAREALAIIPT
jgi:uncharacterized protein